MSGGRRPAGEAAVPLRRDRLSPACCIVALAAVLAGCRGAPDTAAARPTQPATAAPVHAAVARLLASATGGESGDAEVKALAALGEAAIPALAEHLGDGDERVRLVVVQGLGATGSAGAVDPLLEALSDASAEVRVNAVRALGALRARRAAQPLLAQLDRDADAQVRYECMTTLGLIGSGDAPPRLVTELESPDPYARMWAMDALCTMHDPGATTLLPRLLADPDVLVRRQVIRSCHESARTEPSRRALLAITLGDQDFEASFLARAALVDDVGQGPPGDGGRTMVVQEAVAALDGGGPGRARRGAFLLANLGDARAFDVVVTALRDPDALMRHHAAYLLGEVHDQRAVGPLIATLRDETPLVRLTALAALRAYAERGDPQAKAAVEAFTSGARS